LRRRRHRAAGGEKDGEDTAASEEEEGSRSSTPRYILDKAGIFRWPPIKMEDGGGGQIFRKVNMIPNLKTVEVINSFYSGTALFSLFSVVCALHVKSFANWYSVNS